MTNQRRIAALLGLALSLLLTIPADAIPLNLVSGRNFLPAGKYEWPAGKDIPPFCEIVGETDPAGLVKVEIIAPAKLPDGYGLAFRAQGLTIRSVIITGGGLFMDGAKRNADIWIDNVTWNTSSAGEHKSCITFTKGLERARITNCRFLKSGSFGIYGYNYTQLTVANNEFINLPGGLHIDAKGDNPAANDGMLIEQNYFSGIFGQAIEAQGASRNVVIQDNDYVNPDPRPSGDKYFVSAPLTESERPIVRRNRAVMPTKAAAGDGYVRIVYELGGKDLLCEDNYSNGGNDVLAINGARATGTVRNNRFLNFNHATGNNNGATCTLANNGPQRHAPNGRVIIDGSNVQLTWDQNRPRPRPNERYGTQVPPPAPAPDIAALQAELAALKKQLAETSTSAAAERARLEKEILDLKTFLRELGATLSVLGNS